MRNRLYEIMTLSQKLTKLIDDRGINQSKLSRMSGIAPTTISDIIAEKRKPRLDHALLMARSLGVSVDYLADETLSEEPAPAFTDDERRLIDIIRSLNLSFTEVARRLYKTPVSDDAEIFVGKDPSVGPSPARPVRPSEFKPRSNTG